MSGTNDSVRSRQLSANIKTAAVTAAIVGTLSGWVALSAQVAGTTSVASTQVSAQATGSSTQASSSTSAVSTTRSSPIATTRSSN